FNVSVATIHDGMPADFVLGQANWTSGGINVTRNGLAMPSGGIAFDLDHERLFVSDLYRVLEFDVSPLTIHNGEWADHVLGQVNFTSQAGNLSPPSQSTLAFPRGLSYDAPNQRLFVADSSPNRILVFNVAPSAIQDGMKA